LCVREDKEKKEVLFSVVKPPEPLSKKPLFSSKENMDEKKMKR